VTDAGSLPQVRLPPGQRLRLFLVGALVVFALGRVGPDVVRTVYPLTTFGYATDRNGRVNSVTPMPAPTPAKLENNSTRSAKRAKPSKAAKPPVHYDSIAVGDRVLIDRIKPFDRKTGIALRGFSYDNPDRYLEVERGGRLQRLHLEGRTESIPFRILAVVRVLFFAISIGIGAFLFLVKPSIATASFFAFTLGAEAPTTYIDFVVPNPWRPIPMWLTDTIQGISLSGLVLFAICLFDRRGSPQRAALYALAGIGVALGSLHAYADWRATFGALPAELFGRLYVDFSIVLTIVTTAVFVAALVRTRGGPRRRIVWIVIAFSIAGVARLLSDQVFPTRLPVWANGLLIATSTLVPAIAVAVSVIRQRFFGVDFVVSRALIYTALAAAAIGLVVVAEEVATYVFYNNTDFAYIATIGLSLAIGSTTGRIHTFIEYFADRFIFKERRAQRQALELIAGYILDAESVEDVFRALLRDCSIALNLAFAGILLRREDGSYTLSDQHDWPSDFSVELRPDDEITRTIARSRSSLSFSGKDSRLIQQAFPNERLTFAAPIFYDRKVAAIVVYGSNISGLDLDPQEREQLTRVVAHASIALSAIELARFGSDVHSDLPIPEETRAV